MSVYVLNLLGDIGFYTAQDVAWALSSAPAGTETIEVRICSDGGSVFEGLAAFNMLRATGKKVVTKNLGMAGSMASILFLAGDERVMCPGSMLFLHNPYGDIPADALGAIRDSLVGIYSQVSGESATKVGKMLDEQTYLSAEDAVARGYATRLETAERPNLSALARLSKHERAPEAFRSLLMSARASGKPASAGKEKVRMDLAQLLSLLGLPNTATLEEATKAIQALQGETIATVENVEEATARLHPKVQAHIEALRVKASKSEDAQYAAIFASRPDVFTPAVQAKARKWPLDVVKEFVEAAGPAVAAEPAVAPTNAPAEAKKGPSEKAIALAKATGRTPAEAQAVLDKRDSLRFPPKVA